MYRRIHPYYGDFSSGLKSHDKEYYHTAPKQVIRLDTIKRITDVATDGTIALKRLMVSDDRLEDILVSSKEAEEIEDILLAQPSQDGLQEELGRLTGAIRSLWELLRARMH